MMNAGVVGMEMQSHTTMPPSHMPDVSKPANRNPRSSGNVFQSAMSATHFAMRAGG